MTIYDRAAAFGRTCQSPRTGFVHLFNGQAGGDAIPIYENFCFAIALIRQRTAEGVLEGKDLLERLFAFQAPAGFAWEGNFPVYLHDFPRCWNPLQPLRIAPLLVQLLRDFHAVLPEEFRAKMSEVLWRLLEAVRRKRETRPLEPLWERRYLALTGPLEGSYEPMTSAEAAEELITASLQSFDLTPFQRLIHPVLKAYAGPSPSESQEGKEPSPTLLDWWGGSKAHQHHPLQLELAALPLPPGRIELPWSGAMGGWQMRCSELFALSFAPASKAGAERLALRLLWMGEGGIESLCIPAGDADVWIEEDRGLKICFDLPEKESIDRNDLFEAEIYCSLAETTRITVQDSFATSFGLGESIQIQTPHLTLSLKFELQEGEGHFCGHLLRSNRPFQKQCKGPLLHEAFDWKVGIRTLRRSKKTSLCITLKW